MEGPPNGFTLLGGMVRPQSRGSIRLSGPDPDDPLLIDLNAFEIPADLESLEASLTKVREIAAAAPLRDEWGTREVYPGPEVRTAAEVRDYWGAAPPSPTTTRSGPAGWGIDPGAVVDPRLRVHGIDGLRIADASVMPVVTSGNTNAPCLMIGERAADFIAGAASAARTALAGPPRA